METSVVIYTTSDGLQEFRKVPTYLHPSDYGTGILVGPPDLTELGLSRKDTKALNHALVDAKFVDYKSLTGRRKDLLSIVKKALKCTDAKATELRLKVIGLYQRSYYLIDGDNDNG